MTGSVFLGPEQGPEVLGILRHQPTRRPRPHRPGLARRARPPCWCSTARAARAVLRPPVWSSGLSEESVVASPSSSIASATTITWYGVPRSPPRRPTTMRSTSRRAQPALVGVAHGERGALGLLAALYLTTVGSQPGLSERTGVAHRIGNEEVLVVDAEAHHPAGSSSGSATPASHVWAWRSRSLVSRPAAWALQGTPTDGVAARRARPGRGVGEPLGGEPIRGTGVQGSAEVEGATDRLGEIGLLRR